ncbi:hypothetical protein HPB51_003511 [Rhipicephalus microplus]|uniref:MADF domain-containing protein n=1 Tax=Rhipicephalus microplus TaxID=6941 RepID=A0A9J6ELF9_RHIMP|nr:hypothetical protein HPB51_003511 [Rhipicephalus microplus]
MFADDAEGLIEGVGNEVLFTVPVVAAVVFGLLCFAGYERRVRFSVDVSSHPAITTMATFEYSAELLIDAIKMYPYLYDKRHPSFKDSTKKDWAWAEMGNMFGMSSKYRDFVFE